MSKKAFPEKMTPEILYSMCVEAINQPQEFTVGKTSLVLVHKDKPRGQTKRLYGKHGGPTGRVLDQVGDNAWAVGYDPIEVLAFLHAHGVGPSKDVDVSLRATQPAPPGDE